MNRFKPTMYKKDIFSINYEKLKDMGIKCLIFDLDNTLVLLSDKKSPAKVKKLITSIKKDFQIVIISNNIKRRVNSYKEELGIDAVSLAMKPLIRGLLKIKLKYKFKKKEMVMIGDQIVTDIVAGKTFRIKTILVDPLGEKDLKITKLNRKIEDFILNRYNKKGIFERGKYYE